MKKIEVLQINAFTKNNTGGNPAGVVLNADDLTTTQKQSIASRVNFNETAFVSKSTVADFKLEFFTPIKQIAHCGHATIATFSYLKQRGIIQSDFSSKETLDGTREIFFKEGMAFMEQKSPVEFEYEKLNTLALKALGIKENDLIDTLHPVIVNTGNSFLIIPVKTAEKLREVSPDLSLISELSEQYGLIGFYPFTLDTFQSNADASARMLAPFYGIDEESATGMAAGPLATYLFKRSIVRKKYITIEQGVLMRPMSPGMLFVVIENNEDSIRKLFVGGNSYLVGNSSIDLMTAS